MIMSIDRLNTELASILDTRQALNDGRVLARRGMSEARDIAELDREAAALRDELHGRAIDEYRASAHADTRDRFREMVRRYTLDDLHTITLNNFGFGAVDAGGVYRGTMGGYRIVVVRDELHRRALAEHHSIPESGGLAPEESYAIECGNPWT